MIHNLPIDREGVKAFLPHRDPMLFIDEVTEYGGDWIKAVSYVDPDAPFFNGHFPGQPIMPGVLLIETMAQAGALIVSLNGGLNDGQFIAFSGVEAAKFRRPVAPGETLSVEARIVRSRSGFYKFEGTIKVGTDIAAELKFSASQIAFRG